MNKIQLGEEQLQALQSMKTFIESSPETAFTLVGSAGTGKTTIMKELIKWLKYKIDYCLCAPTHKAKLVIEKLTGESEAVTLHKLLSLSPNIEIFNLDFKDLKFRMGKASGNIPYEGVVICDEASMVNDELYKLLVDQCKIFNSKIIFVCDKAQLRPVKSRDISLVFKLKDKFELTKVYRQDKESALMPIFQELREHTIDRFETKNGEKGSLFVFNDATEFLKKSIPYFRKAISSGDILYTKLLAYTNNRVDRFNTVMKQVLFNDDKEYHRFEFLTAHDNLEFNNFKFFNSMDYIITDEPYKTDIFIPDFMTLPGYRLNLYDSVYKDNGSVSILSKDIDSNYMQALAEYIENIRLEAISNKRNRNISSKLWAKYYKVMKSFASPIDLYFDNRLIRKKSFDAGYACTAHRSQGSTFNSVFVDIKNINLCQDEEERRQLQYVALSRTQTDAFILQQ